MEYSLYFVTDDGERIFIGDFEDSEEFSTYENDQILDYRYCDEDD
jgi:hypothetical protein